MEKIASWRCKFGAFPANEYNEVLSDYQPDPYQHPEDEDRDGLRNIGLFHSSTT